MNAFPGDITKIRSSSTRTAACAGQRAELHLTWVERALHVGFGAVAWVLAWPEHQTRWESMGYGSETSHDLSSCDSCLTALVDLISPKVL